MAPPQQLAFPPTALRNVAAGLVVGNPVGSGGTRGKALTAAELKAIVEASGINYLPLSGGTLTGALSLGSNGLTCGAITASGASSIILAGTGIPLKVGRTGANTLNLGNYSASNTESYIYDYSNGTQLLLGSRGQFQFAINAMNGGSNHRVTLSSSCGFGWSATAYADTDGDLLSFRGGPGILQQRNGLNAQCYELFETYTSSTNFGALRLKATSSGHQIGSARGTSGSNRAVQLGHFDSAGTFTSGLSVGTGGDVDLPLRRITSVGTAGVIIAGDASTGSMPLRIQTGSTVLYDFSYSGTISLVPAVSTINIGSGVMHVASASGNRSLVKSYVNLELCPGSLGGGGTYVEINNGTAGTYRDLVCRSITASGESKIILPTADPHIVGCLWNNSGTITISAG